MEDPITPFWTQPSHPDIQEVLYAKDTDKNFMNKSFSKISVPPNGFYAPFDFPPCTEARFPTYATVQMGKNKHLNLNSDLVYINHSCEPSVIFDMSRSAIYAGPRGLEPGDELTFFYPSTEWDMAQGFACICNTASCRGYISGAKNLSAAQLQGLWLNKHIEELLEEQHSTKTNGSNTSNGTQNSSGTKSMLKSFGTPRKDVTLDALVANLELARKTVDAAQKALDTYRSIHVDAEPLNPQNAYTTECFDDYGMDTGPQVGAIRENGIGSRELSGEMGGDTK